LFFGLPHDRSRGLQSNTNGTALVDIGTLGGNSPNHILGGQYRCHLLPPWHAVLQWMQLPLASTVIPEIHIWRAANLMLNPYGGDKALKESASRVDELEAACDHDGADT
jgi:hypothetical protein